ncbi:MAG: hypothetical protein JOZ39_09975 [Chloroflexi bacterium]|nr:hypothetical protein [Chloroflexota bacterium]
MSMLQTIVCAFAVVAGICLLVAWRRGAGLLAFATSSFCLALACFLRIDAIVVAVVASVAVGVLSKHDRRNPERRQAYLLAYLTPIFAALLLAVLTRAMLAHDAGRFVPKFQSSASSVVSMR